MSKTPQTIKEILNTPEGRQRLSEVLQDHIWTRRRLSGPTRGPIKELPDKTST